MNSTTLPVLITGGMAIFGRASHGISPTNSRHGSYGKIVLGTFIAGAMLSAVSGEAERIGAMLAWVAAITSILINGNAVFGALSKVTG